MKSYRTEGARRVLAFIVLLGAVILALRVMRPSGVSLEPQALVERLGAVRQAKWLVPYFFVLFGATSLFAPAFVFFVTAGALWGFWPGCLVGWFAANLWSQAHFFVGRALGRERIARLLENPKLSALRGELEEGGALAVLIVRQLPLPFVGVNVAVGASPMRWTRWSLGNAAGLVPAAAVYSWSAASLLAQVEGARTDALVRLAGAAGAIIALGVLSRLALRRVAR